MGVAIFADVLQVKAARQGEVELNGGKLPLPANGIDELDVDLRAIERGFVGDYSSVHVEASHCILQCVLTKLPLFRSAIVFTACTAVPGGHLGVIGIESEGLESVDRELKTIHDLVLDLIGTAEDVRIVLGEAADPEQTVQDPRTFIPINGTE